MIERHNKANREEKGKKSWNIDVLNDIGYFSTLLSHYGGNVQLETAEHHSWPKELSVHGLAVEKIQLMQRDRTDLNPW